MYAILIYKMLRKYYGKCHVNKYNDLGELQNFFGSHGLPRLHEKK